MYIQSNSIAFNGWKSNQTLEDFGKLNNKDKFKALADTSQVDYLHTNMQEAKWLPSSYLYTNIACKYINNQPAYGVNCAILSKNTPNEVVSEKLFESAQTAIGDLYANAVKLELVQYSNNEVEKCKNVVSDSKTSNIFKKLVQIFSKLKK